MNLFTLSILGVVFYYSCFFTNNYFFLRATNELLLLFDSFFSKPFFSINIPIFNKLPYLNRSISSILCQNFSKYEIVFSDDYSTDGSYDYITNFSKIFPRSTVIRHQQNLGILNARVDAIKSSRGKYIISLDPDDELQCGLLDKLYSYLSKKDYDIVEYEDVTFGKKSREFYKNSSFVVLNRTEILNRTWEWYIWLKCFRREFITNSISYIPPRLFNIRLTRSEDVVIIGFSVIFCHSYLAIDYVGYKYYEDVPGSSGKGGYNSLRRNRKLMYIASNYVYDFWKRYNLTFTQRFL